MTRSSAHHPCCCSCHGSLTFHATLYCDCGKHITAPPPGYPCEPSEPGCPPPPRKPHPGVVDLPQEDPPFHAPRCPPEERPERGSADELYWFRAQIARTRRVGACFGPRKDEFLPFLLVRSTSGDRGGRPSAGVFWESPDIFVAPGVEADSAPLFPPDSVGIARANVPNTLYAHVWNLGKAPAYRVRVEFYWFNPSLGIARSDANLIGAATVDLGNRFSLSSQWREVSSTSGRYVTRGCHAIVRCPQTWIPTFENQGHECLVVRAFEPILDPLSPNQFSAAADRHVGQRNIAVVQAASPAAIDLQLSLGYFPEPAAAEVGMEVLPPDAMEWIQMLTQRRVPGIVSANGILGGFLPPSPAGTRVPAVQDLPAACRDPILRPSERFHRGCDPLAVVFHASAPNIQPNQAQVLRLRQRIAEGVIGGYTVLLIAR